MSQPYVSNNSANTVSTSANIASTGNIDDDDFIRIDVVDIIHILMVLRIGGGIYFNDVP